MIVVLWVFLIVGITMIAPTLTLHVFGLGVVKRANDPSAVYLTFDDGPHPIFTPIVLDALKDAGAKATFFCLGEKVERYSEVVRRISAEGHEVAVHGYDHRHPWADPPWRVARGITITVDRISAVTGIAPRHYRPPWGFWTVWHLLAARNLERTSWSLPAKDWARGTRPEEVARRIARTMRPGDVILLHDGGSYSGVTAESLPSILETIREKGFVTRTLAEHPASKRAPAFGRRP